MNRPPLDQLLQHIDCRYTLVAVAAKRARQLTDVHRQETAMEAHGVLKEVSEALYEVIEDKISYSCVRQPEESEEPEEITEQA
ncbi:MAG: DNA-directed RNA polymerase subunit omega [Clostridia bacterium]|nr:DNA-directed RNA polymerase subunit omega [Clostridia bacterium]